MGSTRTTDHLGDGRGTRRVHVPASTPDAQEGQL